MNSLEKIDTHIHGNYSSDSILDYRKLCQKAIAQNYKVIAFTEHYDLIESEIIEYGLLPYKKYFRELDEIKKEFPDLEIITGIEMGEPHITGNIAKRLFQNNSPEYVIGSLHVTREGLNVSLKLNRPITKEEVRQYYEENLEMVHTGGFDTLGHLGIYKRGLDPAYLPDESDLLYIIDEIFREMIKKNICLEINNSGFKTKFNDFIPESKIIKRYKKLGGELITLASDSHELEHFDTFYDKTLDKITALGFVSLYWKKGNMWNSVDIGAKNEEKLFN